MKNVAIIGGGPAGLMAAIISKRNNPDYDITIFEKYDIAHTLLPTGGGRCNITNNEEDIKLFVQNYPRGEKFLYSILNQFFIQDTIDFFSSIGIKTYTQNDNRIFPISNKSLDVIFALKNEIQKLKIKIKKYEIKNFDYKNEKFVINNELFDTIVIAVGGKNTDLFETLNKLGHKIVEQRPAICGLKIQEKYLSSISGVNLKNILCNIKIKNKNFKLQNDLLFTHKGITGPLAYRISSLFLNNNYSDKNPLEIKIDFINSDNFYLQKLLEKNSKKKIYNLLSDFMPKALGKILLEQHFLNDKYCFEINKEERKIIEEILCSLKLHITGHLNDNVIVTAGGISLNDINPKTMESKYIKNLYFCGEVIDVDGFCGGFNLQNCWSTGFVAGKNI